MLARKNMSFDGMRVSVSGAGNVSQYAIEKVLELGGKVVTCSDSQRHRDRRSRLHPGEARRADGHQEQPVRPRFRLRREVRPQVRAGKRPWGVPVDIALPCATQNEVDGNDARELVKNGVKCVAEGANMPSRPRCRACLPRCQDPVWPGQGRQRRRCCHLGPGNDPELAAPVLVARGGRCAA
jgi:glutamate dehydrogenase (NADP+)